MSLLDPTSPHPDIDISGSDREVLTELNALHARALQRMPIILAVAMTSMGLFMFTRAAALPFVLWALCVVAIEILRGLYATTVLRGTRLRHPRTVHRVMVMLAGIAGATVGVGAAYFIPSLSLLSQAQLSIFLFVIPAAGVAVSQSSRYIVAAYCIPLVVPATIVWMRIHPSLLWTAAFGTPIFCLLMILLAADGDKLLRRSLLIRHERDRLVQDLEQKNAEVQVAVSKAEAAALARARVLAAASHDLRQPLHALSVYSAVLTARPEPAVLAEVGGHIVEMVSSLGSVLNGLLDLSRISSGYYVPERQPVALDQILAPVCAEFVAAARTKGLTLQLDLQPVVLQSDPVALARITRNLIDNAIKYTDFGGVRVTTRAESGTDAPLALLIVSDTGKGIAVEDQQRIFEEFYQIGNPARDRSQGVGLGLAIVQRLVELLDGAITLSSMPGVGSTLTVSMPALLALDGHSMKVPSAPATIDLHGQRIYVIDDEIDVLRGTRTLLESWKLEVHGASTAASAEQLCKEWGPPDLMIVDLRLGEGENGAQLATRLRRSFGQFPVLIVSGETSSTALQESGLGDYPLLHKPVRPDAFRAAVTRALR